MTEKHVLITRSPDRRYEFERCDFLGRWYPHGRGQVLNALLPPLISELREAAGMIPVTISSWRAGSAFTNPDAASIPANGIVVAVCPVEPPPLDKNFVRLRMWQSVSWHCPERPPVLGAKLRQAGVADWLSDVFHRSLDTLGLWQSGACGNMELWIRPQWNAPEMFPELFPSPKPAVEQGPEQRDEKPPGLLYTPESLEARRAEHAKMRQRKLGAKRNARHAADLLADKEKVAAAIRKRVVEMTTAEKRGRK